MKLITYTNPKFIERREDGLNLYQYELHGILESIHLIYCKTVREAIDHAKSVIRAYIERMEMKSKLNKVPTASKEDSEKKPESGWYGINYVPRAKAWNVGTTNNGEQWYVGYYKTLAAAIAGKMRDNAKRGLAKYYGKKSNVINIKG